MKFFIPEEKKLYVLLKDWTFLLYPFNWWHEEFDIENIHGIVNNGEYSYLDLFKCCKYTDPYWKNDSLYQSEKCVVDWFLLTDKEYPNVSNLIRSKEDLKSFGNMEDVRIIYTEWQGRGKNKEYSVFTKGKRYYNREQFPNKDDDNHKAKRFSRDIESKRIEN